MHYIIKEFLESYRSKGIWIMMGILFLTSIFILSVAKSYPVELGFETFLLNLFDMNMLVLPILAILFSGLSLFNEKESRSMQILLTKKESKLSFLLKKTLAIHIVLIISYLVLLFILFSLSKLLLVVDFKAILIFVVSMSTLILICNQLGILIGKFSKTKLELMTFSIIAWFILVILLDLVYMFNIPRVNYDNASIFGFLYFIDPLHTIRLFLEEQLGLFSMNNLSALLTSVIKFRPTLYMGLTIVIWPIVLFLLTWLIPNRGDIND